MTVLVSFMRKCSCSTLLIIGLLLCVQGSTADLTVRFLDVFGGDAVLLEEDGRTMLIDAGPYESGNLTRLYLQSLTVSSLDSVMVTSPAEEHTGALTNILNATPAGEVFTGAWENTGGSYQDILNKLTSDQIPLNTVRSGDTIPFSANTTIHLLNQTGSPDDSQAQPLIPLITHGKIKFLLLGKNSDIPDNSSADIVRVADHGSLSGTDSAGINRIMPKIAVISTGHLSREKPAPSALAIIENSGATIYRTDLDGTITIHTDGEGYSYEKKRVEPEMSISLISVIETRTPGQ
jgi:beta-lactamase superfamily II metal-dependent hydrolase